MLKRQNFTITKAHRTAHNGHSSSVVWLCGDSESDILTIAKTLEKRLFEMGNRTYVLDEANMRIGLNKELGFSAIDCLESVRRVAEVAKLMSDAGLIVIVSVNMPHEEQRKLVREILQGERLLEVYDNRNVSISIQHDSTESFNKERGGEMQYFKDSSVSLEEPMNLHISFDASNSDVNECVLSIANELLTLLKN
jgi:adenylyl-sulfate kinase